LGPLSGALLIVLLLAAAARADISFVPRISVGTAFTDNVFLTPSDEKSDFVTFVSPGFDLDLTGRNSGLGITYDPAYINYTRFPERTYWRHNAFLDGWAEVARGTRVELTNAFLYTQDPFQESDFQEADTTVRQGREPYTRNTTRLGVVNRFGPEDVVDLSYKHHFLENEDPTIEDSSYRQPNLLLTYWFSPNRYAAEMEMAYTVSDFEVSEDFEDLDSRFRLTKRFGRRLDAYFEYGYVRFEYLEEGEDYQVHSPVLGFILGEGPETQFEGSIGYFVRDNDLSDDDDGIVGSFDMTYGFATASAVNLNGRVGYDRAFFGAENLGFRPFYEVGGSLTHLLTRRFYASLSAGYRRNLYIDETPDREDAIWRGGAGLGYRALPWLTFNLDYLYRQLNSNIDANDYVENRATLSVTLSPGVPVSTGDE
jgi:hypothetical protein